MSEFWDMVEEYVKTQANGDDYSYHPATDSYEITRKTGFKRTINVADFEADRRKRA